MVKIGATEVVGKGVVVGKGKGVVVFPTSGNNEVLTHGGGREATAR